MKENFEKATSILEDALESAKKGDYQDSLFSMDDLYVVLDIIMTELETIYSEEYEDEGDLYWDDDEDGEEVMVNA